ncbi:hypothetical protein [Scytonema sp. NUACC21]
MRCMGRQRYYEPQHYEFMKNCTYSLPAKRLPKHIDVDVGRAKAHHNAKMVGFSPTQLWCPLLEPPQ